jgi:hypothetical protein
LKHLVWANGDRQMLKSLLLSPILKEDVFQLVAGFSSRVNLSESL